MEQCLWCQSVYEEEESTANKKMCCCSIECEEKYLEWLKKPLEFVE